VPGGKGPTWTPLAGPIVGFQCLELAERYLFVKYGWAGINQTNGAQVVDHYGAAHSLKPILNDTGKAPAVGDVMSFSGDAKFDAAGGDGHVAIVTAVAVNANGSGTVTVVGENQNWIGVRGGGAGASRLTLPCRVGRWWWFRLLGGTG
jgi:hypothetical protein